MLATLIGAWFTFGAAPAYQSSAALWVDNGPAVASSLSDDFASPLSTASASAIDPSQEGAGSPSAQSTSATPSGPAPLEVQVLYELLASSDFLLAVAKGSLLPQYLESGAHAHGFSPSVLLHRRTELSLAEADDTAAAQLSSDVTAWSPGPQVLEVSYNGPSPAIARSVLQSLIHQLTASGPAVGSSLGKTASTYYGNELVTATQELAGNQGSLAAYARANPHASAANDPTLKALTAETQLAEIQRATVLAASQQANTEAQSASSSGTIEVIDPPTLPNTPTSGLSSKLTGILGGAFAGLVMTLLALMLLTPREPTRWDDEVPLFKRLATWDATPPRAQVRPEGPTQTQTQHAQLDLPPQQGPQ